MAQAENTQERESPQQEKPAPKEQELKKQSWLSRLLMRGTVGQAAEMRNSKHEKMEKIIDGR